MVDHLQNVYDQMITDHNRERIEAADSLYGSIIITRVRGGVGPVVTCAPTVALIDPETLFAERVNIKITGRLITLAGQVVYRITGWDDDQQSLIVLLEEDLR